MMTQFGLRIVKIQNAIVLTFIVIPVAMLINAQTSVFRELPTLYEGCSFQRCGFNSIEKDP